MRVPTLAAMAALQCLVAGAVSAAPYPPADQKRPPLVLRAQGIFWAGGQVVKRTQTGTQNAGDRKGLPFTEQDMLVGQSDVE